MKSLVPKSPQKKGQQTRVLLLERAIFVFAQKSYHSATVEDIAKSASLAKGTIYQYYRSKKDLLLACLDLWQKNMDFRPEELLNDESLVDAKAFRNFLQNIFNEFFEIYSKNTKLLKVLSTTQEKGVNIEQVVQQSFYRMVKSVEKIFTKAMDEKLMHTSLSASHQAYYVVALAYQVAHQSFMVEAKVLSSSMAKSMCQFVARGLELPT